MSIRRGSSEDVEKVKEDLFHCRSRLEAGVEENKRNRDLIQELTDQVQRFRQRTAHETIRLVSSTPHASSLPQLCLDIASSPYIDYVQPSHHLSQILWNQSRLSHASRNRSLDHIGHPASSAAQSSSFKLQHNHSSSFMSSPRLVHCSEERLSPDGRYNVDELISRLKSELFKNNALEEVNDILREENDAALEANDNLRQDIVELTRALEQLEHGVRNERERFSAENAKYRNQLEQQHRQLIEVWKSFLAVKRSVRELHISTASDLDKQLTEFTRCTAMVKKAIRHAEFKKIMLFERVIKGKDEMLEEVNEKYENVSTSQNEVEKQLTEKTYQLQRLQEEHERTRDNNEDLKSALTRICGMAELNFTPFRLRARSESPSFPRTANDVMRKIRSVLSTKAAEVREANARVERAEKELIRSKKQIEMQEQEKKSHRDYERRRDQEANERELRLSTMEHDLRRTTEKLLSMEQERNLRESLLTTLQNTLTSTHRNHKEFIESLVSNHRDELAARDKLHENEVAERLNEERIRSSRMQAEVDREKMEVESLRQQLRDLKAEYSAVQKVAEEKDLAISSLQERLVRLKSQIDTESAMLSAKNEEITEKFLRCEELVANEQQLEQELNEMRISNTILGDENNALQGQIMQLRSQIESLSEKTDTASQQEKEWKTRLEESQLSNIAHERSIQDLKESVRLLEEKLESDAEKVKILKEQLEYQRTLTREKSSENSEMLKQIEGMKIERDGLMDDISTLRSGLTTANSKMAQLKSDAEKRVAEENEKLAVLEDFRRNFDLLTNKIKQKEVLIEDLQEQLKMLQSLSVEKEDLVKAEKIRHEESLSLKEKECDEHWSEKLRVVKDQLSKREKLLNDYESRWEQLTRRHEKLVEEERSTRAENAELKKALQELILKHKKEVDDLVEQNALDREDLEKEMQQLEETRNALVTDLRADLVKSEAEAEEAAARADAFSVSLNDAKEKIKRLQQQIEKETTKREKEDSDYKERGESQERARLALTAELEESQVKLTKSAAQLEEAYRKNRILESTLEKLEAALERKSLSVKELEEKVDELRGKVREYESSEQNYMDRITILEKRDLQSRAAHSSAAHANLDLSIAKDKVTNGLIEEQKKTFDLEQSLREVNKEVKNAELKARSEQECKRDGKLHILASEIRQLEIQLADRTAKGDMSAMLAKKLELERQSIFQELDKQKHTNVEVTRQNEELRVRCKALEDGLASTKAILEKKTNVSKQAMADLLSNYKDSEKKYMEREMECEKLKAEVRAIKSKLESVEKRKAYLATQLDESEVRNADLAKKLQQHERSAKMALGTVGSKTTLQSGQSISDIPKASSSGFVDSFSMVRPTSSSHDLSFAESPERAVHFHGDDTEKNLDIGSSMEITLRYLKERIEQLERDKTELTNDLVSQREELRESSVKMKKASDTVLSLERRINVLQSENENLESRLATQRQLYVSNEEAMRAKDLEHRGLKAKIISADLHIREKDSLIARLTNQLETLRVELSQMAAEKQKLNSTAKAVEQEARAMEDDARAFQKERELLAKQLADTKVELQVSHARLTDYESELQHMKGLLEDARNLQQKERERVVKIVSEEKHWEQLVATTKKSEGCQRLLLEEKIAQLQHDYDMLLSRNNSLIGEIGGLRKELRESNHRFDQLTLKLSESEKSLEDVNQSKKSLVQQISAFQKAEDAWKKLEREMREELAVLRKDRLVLTADVEALKRKLVRAEVERKEVDGSRARLDREVTSLKKHVEALEEDKCRTEAAIRNTMSERRAIDKSLAAMEKENTELYRNCAQLQSQIAQLERDSGTSTVVKVLKDQGELEARLAKLVVEKQQLEMIIEQKEMNFSQERRTMESKVEMLRNQLEMEKKRRLDSKKETRTRGDAAVQERYLNRASDLRMGRAQSIQQRMNPFRMQNHRAVSRQLYERTYHYQASISSVSPGSFVSNDTSTSIETVIN